MMSRNQLHHLSGAYVLNALDDEERRDFESCLAEWEDMRAEVTELADTAAALGRAVPPVQPRPSARADLLARIAAAPQAARSPDLAPRLRRHRGAGRPAGRPSPSARSTRPPVLWVSAALGTLLVLLAVFPFLVPSHGEPELSVARIEGAADVRRVPVPLPGGDGVELIWSEELGASALTWEHLPPLEPNRAYELWYLDDSTRPAGLVTDESPGGRVLAGPMERGVRVGITIEPAGGSAVPTSLPLVVVETA